MAGRVRAAVSWFVFVLALVPAALALAALGGAWNGRLDLLTHLSTLTFTAAAVLLAVASRVGGPARRGSLGVTLLTLVCAGALMGPDIARSFAPKSRAAPTLTLMTLNLWPENVDPEGTARIVLAADPDVVVLEEATAKGQIAAHAIRARYPYGVGCEGPTECALAIYSKLPIAAGEAKAQDWNRRPFDTLRTAWARIEAPGKPPFTVVATRYGTPSAPWLQRDQRRRLATFLGQFDRSSLILAGDFNSSPWSFAMREQDRLLQGLERRTRALPTWPARWPIRGFGGRAEPVPLIPIDHVYAGASWKTVSVKRGPRTGSDHYPVIVALAR